MSVEEVISKMQEMAQNTHSCSEIQCHNCMDTGWIQVEIADGYTGVSPCGCQNAKRAEARLRRSGLMNALKEQNFDSFIADSPIQHYVLGKAKEYTETLIYSDGKKPWFYIGGNPGSGKTHICTAICGELMNHNVGVIYMQWITESRRLKSIVNDEDYEAVADQYIDCEVLYIDDLFKQTYRGQPILTDADIRLAFAIINGRYLKNKATIISSEWDLIRHLLPADEGTFSRVYERAKQYTVTIPRAPENNYRLKRAKGMME